MDINQDIMDEMNATNSSGPPTHLLSDYVEIAYLALIIALGTPINLYILVRLIKDIKSTPADSVKFGFILMKINLNLSDLLLLLGYCVWKLAWLSTYSWEGGTILCKVYSFSTMMALYLSSNVVVCIAFDRLRNVISANKLRRHTAQPVRIMLTLAWTLAVTWSLPQIYIWTTYNVYANWPGGWYQCTDIWSIPGRQDEVASTVYQVAHLVLVFWGPLLILIIAYIFIAIKLLQYSLQPATAIHEPPSPNAIKSRSPRSSLLSSQIPSSRSLNKEGGQAGLFNETEHKGNTLSPNTPLLRNETDKNTHFVDNAHQGEPSFATAEFTKEGNCVTLLSKPTDKRKPMLRFFSVDSKQDSHLSLAAIHKSPNANDFHVPSKGEGLRKTFIQYFSNQNTPRASVPSMPVVTVKLFDPPSPTPSSCSKIGPGRPRVPAWRRQLRSKVFRTTLLVVLTHVLFWLPYNIYALAKYVNIDVFHSLNDHANIFKDLQIIITLINPFLYGFSQSGSN